MAARGVSLDDLAKEIGIQRRSLINIIHGTAQSRATQQRLTNFLNTRVWRDIPVTEKIIPLPAGTVVIFPDDESLNRFVQQVGSLGNVSANTVALACSTELHFRLDGKKIPSS
jgi:hypothetical protein